MELLFLWLILGVIAIMVAASKGRNFFLWLFLGILLGPLALLYAALTEEK
jgi:hypothetical protein